MSQRTIRYIAQLLKKDNNECLKQIIAFCNLFSIAEIKVNEAKSRRFTRNSAKRAQTLKNDLEKFRTVFLDIKHSFINADWLNDVDEAFFFAQADFLRQEREFLIEYFPSLF